MREASGREPVSVTVDGRPAGLKRSAQELVVTPATSIAKGQRFMVRDVVPRRLASRWLPKLKAEVSQLESMRRQVGACPFDRFGPLMVDSPFDFALETQTLALSGPAGAAVP